ncbi:hypothetical protein GJAV_G00121740 [Gymnothorax javanicus]|nr:hypothetical protein GJAV_G00121740 [Gymnothorax javanicus]
MLLQAAEQLWQKTTNDLRRCRFNRKLSEKPDSFRKTEFEKQGKIILRRTLKLYCEFGAQKPQIGQTDGERSVPADDATMGRIFLDHIGGTRLFSCANCDTILTNRSELISTRFTGATGRAFLFNKVVNLQYSDVQDRVMLTGRHMVRDVSCKNCNSKLGWIYEFATEDSQRYKEGRVILERALVRESEGFEEHVPSDNS